MTLQPTLDHSTDSADQALDPSGVSAPSARRLRMREFQTRLVDRMQAARGGIDARAGQLGVTLGQENWLLDLQQAGEIVAVGSITAVPLTQPWFLGLTNIRGNLISVVDLAQFRGAPATVIDKQCRIIAFAPTLGFNGGVLVSRVLGLRNLSDMRPCDDAEAGRDASEHAGQPAAEHDTLATLAPQQRAGGGDRRLVSDRYVDREQAHWQVLDLLALTQDARFLHVAA